MEHEYECDELLLNLVTPPPEPPKPPRSTLSLRRRVRETPPKFALVSDDFYNRWAEHIDKVKNMKAEVNAAAPPLRPKIYLKPQKFTTYAKQTTDIMTANKDMVKKICLIQRNRGKVECWLKRGDARARRVTTEMLMVRRRKEAAKVQAKNAEAHERIKNARSDMLATKELDEHWRKTKANLVQSATLPFILFSKEGIDKGIKDPTFTKPDGVFRNKVSLNLRIKDGGKFGRLFIELFDDICPEACQYFVNLIKGDDDGYAYSRTKLFRIVPSLFCRGGDVEKNNGWGFYKIPDGTKAIADKSILRHTVPGVVSLVVNKDGELNGQFNIVFKPLPQFDGKHVVIGRIVSGPADALTRISAQGRSLGTVAADVVIEECGRYTESGSYTKGDPNTRKFPPLKKEKNF